MTAQVPYAEVIGDPVDHSKSPAIHLFWLQKLGMAGDYRRTQVRTGELAAFLAQRRPDPLWRGCNVTMPLKLAVSPLVDDHRDPAAAAEPVNLVVPERGRLRGTNTDVFGVLEPLRALQAQRLAGVGEERAAEPRRAVVLGSGGVLHSVVRALKSLGYWPITVVARSEAKVRCLLGPSGSHIGFLAWGSPLPRCHLLVNATPLGMAGQEPMPYDAGSLLGDGILFEMIYQPLPTPLLADGQARGLATVDGLQMLVAQAAPSFERFFGAPPPRDHDAELRALLTA
jgi:shikimate dehydrogenase